MPHARAVALMVFVTLLWSSAGVVTRQLDAARSFEVTFWRSAATLVVLAVVMSLAEGRGFWRGFGRPSLMTLVSGLCWSVMFTSFMVALTLTSVANVLIIIALGPLLTALSARLFLAHRLPVVTWLAIVAAGLGIVWMFAHEQNSSLSLLGSLVALGIPIGAAVNFTVLQSVGMGRGSDSGGALKAARDMRRALLLGAAVSACATLPLAWPLQASAHDVTLLSLLGLFQLAIPCLLVIRLSRVLPAPEITLLSLLEVIFGVTWAWLWAGETLSPEKLSGGLVVVAALALNGLAGMVRGRRRGRASVSG